MNNESLYWCGVVLSSAGVYASLQLGRDRPPGNATVNAIITTFLVLAWPLVFSAYAIIQLIKVGRK